MTPRRKRNLIDVILSDSVSPVVVFDAERRIRFFSPGFEQLTGWLSDEVEGTISAPATTATSGPLELLTSACSPSQQVMAGEPVMFESIVPRKQGGSIRVQLTQLPLQDADGHVTRVVVLGTPILQPHQKNTSLTQTLHAEITSLRNQFRKRFSDTSFLGDSEQIQLALHQAQMLKTSRAGYCISGSSGTGRRHLARVIHNTGERSDQSFVALDCPLLTADVLADTIARLTRISSEHAPAHQQTGTLLLVDADRCPREIQSWLCLNRDLYDSKIRLAATSQHPLPLDGDGQWLRADFCRMLSTLQIFLPDLHHRGHDIDLLAQHFVEENFRTANTSAETLSDDVRRELAFYRWPGNVRELRDVIGEACQNSFGVTLELDDLPFAFRTGMDAQTLQPAPQESVQSLEDIMIRFEKDVLQKTLDSCGGNKAEAARRLGMTRPRLYRRLTTLGMNDEDDAPPV